MKVLIAVDCDEVAMDVAAFVVGYGWPRRSQFKLVHVIQPPARGLDGSVIESPFWDKARGPITEECTKIVKSMASTLMTIVPSADVSTIVTEGRPVEQILQIAADWSADLIIMGSRGRRGLQALLGSVSRRVLAESDASVAVVHPSKQTHVDSGKRVLVAIDSLHCSKPIIDSLLACRWTPEDSFRLVAVLQPLQVAGYGAFFPPPIVDEVNSNRKHQAEEVMERLATQLREALAVNQIATVIAEGQVDETLRQMAAQWRADVIVLGARGSHGLLANVLGSVSSSVASTAPCPVMVVRWPDKDDSDENATAATKATTV